MVNLSSSDNIMINKGVHSDYLVDFNLSVSDDLKFDSCYWLTRIEGVDICHLHLEVFIRTIRLISGRFNMGSYFHFNFYVVSNSFSSLIKIRWISSFQVCLQRINLHQPKLGDIFHGIVCYHFYGQPTWNLIEESNWMVTSYTNNKDKVWNKRKRNRVVFT